MSIAVLSDNTIRKEIAAGNIVLHDPDRDCSSNIQNCSVDVTLGPYFYRNTRVFSLINPWNEQHVKEYWGEPQYAGIVDSIGLSTTTRLPINTQYIRLDPKETILGHTREFIGGRNDITTMIKARSSLGRNNITVCRDAGWGDIGYFNRYTLEITNNGSSPIILPVGARIAQVIFFYTDLTSNQYEGKYQSSDNLETLVKSWHPSMMLPKLHLEKLS